MGPIYLSLVIVLGLFLGSLINLVSTRLSAQKPLFGPLGCTRGKHGISVVQALPLLGFLAQGGKCSVCGKKLSLAYPVTELLTASLIAGLFWLDGWGLPFLFHSVYAAILILVLVIDWKHRDIYFSVIIAGSILALMGLFVLPGMDLTSGLVGAGVAGGFFLVAYLLARLIFPHIEEPLGLGDVLLALMMGLMLGFPNIVGALLVGPLIAGIVAISLLVSRRSKIGDFMPYGVSLCAATILFLVYPAPFAEALRLPALMVLLGGIFH